MNEPSSFPGSCPFPIQDHPTVQMAHGGGGRMMGQLIEEMFLAAFGGPAPEDRHDSAVLAVPGRRLAFTTDAFVVRPIFFPGGNLGSLAVHGTVNDLAMSGAQPSALSAAFILEEGFSFADLWKIVSSMAEAAREAGVSIVTGDTKVVDKGKGDGVFITTSGVGWLRDGRSITPGQVRAGDAIILSGDLGRHGMAVMAQREGLEFESEITSDSSCVAAPVLALLEAGVEVHCLRDLTRGGLTAALHEIAGAARVGMDLSEVDVPVRGDVAAACELLGLDPMQVACEGRFAAMVAPHETERSIEILQRFEVSQGAVVVGCVTDRSDSRVILESRLGARRILDLPAGEQLPRIC